MGFFNKQLPQRAVNESVMQRKGHFGKHEVNHHVGAFLICVRDGNVCVCVCGLRERRIDREGK